MLKYLNIFYRVLIFEILDFINIFKISLYLILFNETILSFIFKITFNFLVSCKYRIVIVSLMFLPNAIQDNEFYVAMFAFVFSIIFHIMLLTFLLSKLLLLNTEYCQLRLYISYMLE